MCECRRVKPRNDKGVVAEVARHTNRSSTRPLQHGIEQHVAAGSKVFRRGAFAFVVADAFLAGHEDHRRRRHPADVAGVMRSEEHTSELQSLMRTSSAVYCLKKTKIEIYIT